MTRDRGTAEAARNGPSFTCSGLARALGLSLLCWLLALCAACSDEESRVVIPDGKYRLTRVVVWEPDVRISRHFAVTGDYTRHVRRRRCDPTDPDRTSDCGEIHLSLDVRYGEYEGEYYELTEQGTAYVGRSTRHCTRPSVWGLWLDQEGHVGGQYLPSGFGPCEHGDTPSIDRQPRSGTEHYRLQYAITPRGFVVHRRSDWYVGVVCPTGPIVMTIDNYFTRL